MCRWMAWSGQPVLVEELLFKSQHGLIDQSLHSRMGAETTNGDGFGLGWYREGNGGTPARYRSVTPAWSDANLRDLAAHIESPLFLAHIRATAGTPVQQTNCHMVFPQSVDGFDRVERGEDGLNGNAAIGDELAAGAAECHRDGRRPAVLPHEHACDRAGFQHGAGRFQVVLTEQAGRRALEIGEAPALLRDFREVPCPHRPVLVLDDEREVEDPDEAAIDKIQEERHHLAGDRLIAGPLQDHVVDRAHLFELLFAHGVSLRAEV
jgi:hypothetical protein